MSHGLPFLTRSSGHRNSLVVAFFAGQGRDGPTENGGVAGASQVEGQEDNVFVYEDINDMDPSILEELESGRPSDLMIMKEVSSNFRWMCATISTLSVGSVLSQIRVDEGFLIDFSPR